LKTINWGIFALAVSIACLVGLVFAGIAHRRTQQEIWEIHYQNVKMQNEIDNLKPKPYVRPSKLDYIEPEMTR
jgi:hypothetical protein